MKFLIDECLHTSLVQVAIDAGHEASHVNWLGLSGETDWGLMPRIIADDFTFITNNARDFRKLYARQPLHASLVIILPQAVPQMQRRLLMTVLEAFQPGDQLVNEVIEVTIDGDAVEISRYELPG